MHADEQRQRAHLDRLLADLQARLEDVLEHLDEEVQGEDAAPYERLAAQARALAAEVAAARGLVVAPDQAGDLMLAALREADQPLREMVLYERLRERGAALSPEEFVALASDLATLGRVRVTVEHDLPARDPAPFQARFYRPAT
ncbi:MAG TPA: hypothetical protein VHK00_00260 [Miltoncostaeaceae bacterium]|jgi:hypothetical protein|nr:hypothetical protein [Miltoncostaeaceae bacterium]